MLNRKTDTESLLVVLEAEHDRLLVEIESLNSRLQKLTSTEEESKDMMESDPKAITRLETRLEAIDTLLVES